MGKFRGTTQRFVYRWDGEKDTSSELVTKEMTRIKKNKRKQKGKNQRTSKKQEKGIKIYTTKQKKNCQWEN